MGAADSDGGKKQIRGGRSKRTIAVDIYFDCCSLRLAERVPVIVECKCYSNPLTTSELGKFAYDLLDIRANQDYKHAIGICLTNSTYGPGPKLISAAEDIAIAHFDHLSEDATVAFLLEDVIPWFVEPDKRLTGNLAFSGKTANFESSAALLYALGEFIEERYQGVIPRP